MRVLHVSEAMGGGIVSSLLAMVEATPGVDHHLALWQRREHRGTGDDLTAAFASVQPLPAHPVAAIRELRRVERDLFADVVHAHSSYAGVLTRVAGLDRGRVAYSPHCFATERRNTPRWQRRAADALERALVARTGLLVGVSPYELELAAGLGHEHVAYVPNRSLLTPRASASFADPVHVAAVGRIAPQKDWRYLLHVKRYAEDELGVEATWEWLGGGDPDGESALREAGVEVSGWIPREELAERLGAAQVYLHTAAWEGAPISVLEAASLGLPLAVRAISPIASLEVPGVAATPADLAARIRALTEHGAWTAAQRASLDLAAEHSRAIQGRTLYAAYESLAGQPAAPRALAPVGRPGARAAGYSA